MSPSTPRPPTRRVRLPALVIAFGLLLAGCQDPTSSSSSAPLVNAGISAQPTTTTDNGPCPPVGPGISTVLPSFPGTDFATVLTNPCLPYGDLVGNVMSLVPADYESRSAFQANVASVVDNLTKLNDAVGCAYETDSLGINVYRQTGHPASVGIALVFRPDLGAAVKVGFCYLQKQVFLDEPAPTTAPSFRPCLDGATVQRDGGEYTMVWAGTTDRMCDKLAGAAR